MVGTRARRLGRTLGVAVALVAALAGCTVSGVTAKSPSASAGPKSSHSATATPSATPTPTVDPVVAYVTAKLASMSLQQKVASLLMLHQAGTDGTQLRSFVDQYGLGGLILMGDNMPDSPDQLSAETAAISSDPGLPVLIATDEEGGDVARLPWDKLPGAEDLRNEDPSATTDAFSQRATMLQQAGINLNFGVVADVTANPDSFIFDRVLGTDPQSSSARVSAAVTAENGKVLSTLKHFPGHGETTADSHVTVPANPTTLQDWQQRDAPSFQAGITAGAQVVMFGQLIYSAIDSQPATLSATWHQILQSQLGFTGVTITDDMNMLQDSGLPQYQDPSENAIQALAAGNTMLLFVLGSDPASNGTDPATLINNISAAVQEGRISEQQIDDDVSKVLTLRRGLSPQASGSPTPVP